MAYFAVIVERGTPWDWTLPMRKQNEWDAHALGGEDDAPRILHIVDAPDGVAALGPYSLDRRHR